MNGSSVDRVRRSRWAAGVAAFVLSLAVPGAQAATPLGLYVGGAFGQARVEATLPDASQFREDHSAFEVILGVRPLPVAAAELAYVDFGHPSRLGGSYPYVPEVSMKGATAFAMFYLPVPVVEVFVKGGVARLQSKAGLDLVCSSCLLAPLFLPISHTNTSFAGGAGVQYKLGAFAVRGEYERFNAAGGNPHLLSLGVTWAF